MAQIGRPQNQDPNPYRNVKIANVAKLNSGGRANLREKLNDAAGVGRDSRFVDETKHNQMDKDAFLKLLTYQLANQDPLNPVDQKKFSAELAQFAQLEQSEKMNKNIEKLASNHPTENKFMAASFLGKEVQSQGSSIKYDGKSARTQIPFFLDRDAENVFIRIKDPNNNIVGQFEAEKVNAGTNTLYWDGIATDGEVAPPGDYRFEVIAFDRDAERFNGRTRATGLVTDVHFEGKETVLTVDGKKKVFLRDVISFGLPQKSKQNDGPKAMNKAALSQYQKTDQME